MKIDERFGDALAAGAQAFAERWQAAGAVSPTAVPVAGTAESMFHVLREVARINDREKRGVAKKEMRGIAQAAGMDPRGMAGYYTGVAQLLRKDRGKDARWITDTGRARMQDLARRVGTVAP